MCIHNLCFDQKYENSQKISTENFHFYSLEKSLYVAWVCFHNDTICGSPINHSYRDVRKPAFYICENKDADQLRGNREADQRLCFRYTDSTTSLLNSKFQASSHLRWVYSLVCVRPGRKPRRQVFSRRHAIYINLDFI